MSNIETNTVVVVLSEQWEVFEDGGRLLAHGPENTEVIASLVKAESNGVDLRQVPEYESVKLRLLNMMRRNASHSELRVVKDVSEIVLESGATLVSLSCISTDAETTFNQYLMVAPQEILYVTYEGPATNQTYAVQVESALVAAKIK